MWVLLKVEVKAVNPTRSQLNELLGIEDTDDDKTSGLHR